MWRFEGEENKLILWGKGFHSQEVLDCLDSRKCTIVGWIDKKYGSGKVGEDLFFLPSEVKELDYDYIIVTPKLTESIVDEIKENSIPSDKVIFFWKSCKEDYAFFDSYIAKLRRRVRNLEFEVTNMPYELGLRRMPQISSLEDTLIELIRDRKSLCRFGDGEMRWIVNSDIIHSVIPIWFQQQTARLNDRLKEVIKSSDDRIIIAVSDVFGNLDDFVESDKNFYRAFFSIDNMRERLMEYIDLDRIYGNAFVSRPYWHYPDKSSERCDRIFNLWKKLWMDRDVLLVEGEYVRMGMGNDLFDDCRSLRRILCPYKDAFSYYDEILTVVCEYAKSTDLILLSLGPTATIMAYDLAIKDYQAVDVGQLDNEYEWYKLGTKDRIAIKGKGVAESDEGRFPTGNGTEEYLSQIILKIHTVT